MAEDQATIVKKYWARAWAKAALEARNSDPSFKVKLETDPLLAYRQLKTDPKFGPLTNPVIAAIESYEDDIFAPGEKKFSQMNDTELNDIIKNGKAIKHNELKP